MTETLAPARRRRHARVIALAAELVGECSRAALDVYGPIAEAPPGQQQVPVFLDAVKGLAEDAAHRFDTAAAEDADRWPGEVARETAVDEASFHRRCAALEAERIVHNAEFGEPAPGPATPGTLRLPDTPQLAAMGLVGAGVDFLDALDRDPTEALDLVQGLTNGEFTSGQILDDALSTAVVGAVLLLRNAAREDDPSTAAEYCLNAARAFVSVVTVASIDLDGEDA
ncbi:hypothetical protein [Streptomyces sp. NPDC047525]|uniref:hypothetical protein n=1 Tax=Streptomyces sp. NPDC047525 TaxID=3155264 RepID=UPI0033EC25A7